MPSLIINGQEASLSQQEFADFHGLAVFTTLRSHKGSPLLWSPHWQRLSSHARFFGYFIPREEEVHDLLKTQLALSGADQKIRIIIAGNKFAISCEDYLKPPSIIYRGVKTIFSSFQVHPQLAPYKTSSSLPYLLARQEAERQGAFEALMSDNQGHIVDGSRTSLMHFDGHRLIALKGGLDGCMRSQALNYARMQGIATTERYMRPHELVDQLLLANSLMGVIPVGVVQYSFIQKLIDCFRDGFPSGLETTN
jgi:4-amino-4-deoxychorismate lyase